VLAAIRAGAAEYVYPPVADHLGAALERVAESRSQNTGRALGKTVAFVSAKGGCGATTVACHVATSLRQLTGKTTLLADFDLDNGVIGFLTKTKSSYTVEDAIQNVGRLDTSYWKALVSQAEPGLEVICAPGADTERRTEEGRDAVIDFTRTQYDWIVVDLGRGLTRANRNALQAIDEVYVVTTLDVPALYRCQQMVRSLVEMGCSRDRLRLVVNRISKNAELTKAEIEHMIGIPVSFELQDDAAALGEAYVEGKLLPANSDLAKRMGRIARQIAGIAEPVPSKSRLSLSWLVKTADTRVPQVA
jgi:pilus assembly protein CpaE